MFSRWGGDCYVGLSFSLSEDLRSSEIGSQSLPLFDFAGARHCPFKQRRRSQKCEMAEKPCFFQIM